MYQVWYLLDLAWLIWAFDEWNNVPAQKLSSKNLFPLPEYPWLFDGVWALVHAAGRKRGWKGKDLNQKWTGFCFWALNEKSGVPSSKVIFGLIILVVPFERGWTQRFAKWDHVPRILSKCLYTLNNHWATQTWNHLDWWWLFCTTQFNSCPHTS